MTLCKCGCNKEANWGEWIKGHWNKGKRKTEETIKKTSKSNIGKHCGDLNPSKRPEVRAKISNKAKERCQNIENRKKLYEQSWKYWSNPENKIKQSKLKKKYFQNIENRKKASEAQIGLQSGENNPMYNVHRFKENAANWQGGLSFLPYCYKFNNTLKNEIRKRDDYICQHPDCLCTQLESIIIYKKTLTIHHVHYDKENCYPDLICLCNKHNTIANGNRKYHEELFMKILEKRGLLNWKSEKDKNQQIF